MQTMTIHTLDHTTTELHLSCRIVCGRDVWVRGTFRGVTRWEHYRRDRSGLERFSAYADEPQQIAGLEALAKEARALDRGTFGHTMGCPAKPHTIAA
jgi:hypothetical protein